MNTFQELMGNNPAPSQREMLPVRSQPRLSPLSLAVALLLALGGIAAVLLGLYIIYWPSALVAGGLAAVYASTLINVADDAPREDQQ